MKAVVAQRYGGPEVLDLVERPEIHVGPADVLIDVRAASLNPLDYKIRNGSVKIALNTCSHSAGFFERLNFGRRCEPRESLKAGRDELLILAERSREGDVGQR